MTIRSAWLMSHSAQCKARSCLFKASSGGDDWGVYFAMLAESGQLACVTFILYIIFVWLSVTNIITSLFIDKAMKLAVPDMDDVLFEKRCAEIKQANEMKHVFDLMNVDKDEGISLSELRECIQDANFRSHCEIAGINIRDTEQFFEMLTSINNTTTVDLDTFVSGCMHMRGLASSAELIGLKFEMRQHTKYQSANLKKIWNELSLLKDALCMRNIQRNGFDEVLTPSRIKL